MSILVITKVLLSAISCIQDTLLCFYQVSLFVGYSILVTLAKLFQVFCLLLFYASEFLKVLQDDFVIFSNDVSAMLQLVWALNCDAFGGIVETLVAINKQVTALLNSLYLSFIRLFDNSVYGSVFLSEPVYLCLGALSLIGRCAALVASNVCSLIQTLPYLPLFISEYFNKTIISFRNKMQAFMNVEALYGLCILLTTCYFCYKSKFHIKVGSICQKICCRIFSVVVGYLHCFISIIRNCGVRFVHLRKRLGSGGCPDGNSKEAGLLKQLEREKAAKLCVVCMDKERNIMLFDCKHLVLCHSCADLLVYDGGLCPVCRSYVTHMVNVYL